MKAALEIATSGRATPEAALKYARKNMKKVGVNLGLPENP
jgi:hypothetical protein